MRDGVKLATDLYVPAENGQPVKTRLPALLLRTPYNKSAWGLNIVRFFAQHGYLSVTQDCRGRFASEGKFFPFIDEPKDGHDTITWLARHPLCNGKVGLHGPSYMAWVQFQAATQAPPGLVTMIPHQGPINAYHYSMRCGGALHLGLLRWIVSVAATSHEAAKDGVAAQAIGAMLGSRSFLEWATRIPWKRGQTPLARMPQYEEAALQLYFDHNDYNSFWSQPGLGMDEYLDRFPDMPILWVTSWFDWYPRTLSDGYQKMVRLGRKNQHLIIGPWSHNNFDTVVGDVNFGNRGGRINTYDDFLRLELAWFDRWMKDDAGAPIGPAVQVFEMGGGDGKRGPGGRLNHGGQWRFGASWPPRNVQPTPFYLHEAGVLTPEKPTKARSSRTYRYDPRKTVSSNGRCIIAYGPAAGAGFRGMGPRDQIELETLPGHGTPGSAIADRPDVLVYQTAPLVRDVRIAGNLGVVLWVSSDAPDTDFYVKLLDVHPVSTDYPRGYAFPVSEGILRARYREGFEKSALLKAGQTYRLTFPLEPAANVFKAGHHIRLDVYSSNFPNFDINPNTGDPNDRRPRVATNTVHQDADHASYIELPQVP
jgi:putative CocE/NonD family hydrolase